MTDNGRADENKGRSRNKALRGGSKKRGGDNGGGSRDAYFKVSIYDFKFMSDFILVLNKFYKF
jgi:hypothetical protein